MINITKSLRTLAAAAAMYTASFLPGKVHSAEPTEWTLEEDKSADSATVISQSQPVQAPLTLTVTGKPVAPKPSSPLIKTILVNAQVKADYGTANQSSKAPNGTGILESDLTGSLFGIDARVNPTLRLKNNNFTSLPIEYQSESVKQNISLEGFGKSGTLEGPESKLFLGAGYTRGIKGKDLDSLVGIGLGFATFSRDQKIEYFGAKSEQITSSNGFAPVLSYGLLLNGRKIIDAMFRRASTSGTDKVNTTIPVLGALPEIDSKYSRTDNEVRLNVYLPEVFSVKPSFESELEWMTEKYTDNTTKVVDTLNEANLGLELQLAYAKSFHGVVPVGYIGTRNMLSGDSSVNPGSENAKSHAYGGVMVKYDFSHNMLKPSTPSATKYEAPVQPAPIAQAVPVSVTPVAQSKPLPVKKVVQRKPAVKQKKPSKK